MVQRHPKRTDQEWLDLIHECRTSGLTDQAWCEIHHIHRSSFYYHVRRLRNKACEIPESSISGKISPRQEVVPLEVRDEKDGIVHGLVPLPDEGSLPDIAAPSLLTATERQDQTAVCIRFREVSIEILNGADSAIVRDALSVLGSLC